MPKIIEKFTHRMKTFEAVIFDMDGVLVDSEPHHVEIEKKLFQKFGLPVTEKEHVGNMGTATDTMWKKVNQNHQGGLDVAEMLKLNYQECNNHFSSLEKMEPMPGLVNVLEVIKKRNIPMAVASSSSFETINIILEKAELKNYFQQIVSSSMVAISKPDPDIFLHAAQLLQADPANCMVIEDSSNGVKAAKAAGMFCVAYSGAATGQKQPEADIQINHFEELERIMKQFFENH